MIGKGIEDAFDIPSLSNNEMQHLLGVLERNSRLQLGYIDKRHRLKSELSWIRRKGAIKVGGIDNTAVSRACGRCQAELGLILNRGALCPSCKQRVCKECREHGPLGKDWVCIVCKKQIEIQLATGEWMNEFVRRPSRKRDKNLLSAAEGVRKTLLRRSWSISSPTTSSCDLNAKEDIVKRKPPKKPPRKSLIVEKNDIPCDDTHPKKPLRRNSMTSFDGRRYLMEKSDSVCMGRHQEPLDASQRKFPPKALSTQYLCPPETPKYFFGSEPFNDSSTRASTLPRRPRHKERPMSYGEVEDYPNRFLSIPRRRVRRSPIDTRGRSEPPPLKERGTLPAYVSSGPVTSTPICVTSDNDPCLPILRQNNLNRSYSLRSEGHGRDSSLLDTPANKNTHIERTQDSKTDSRRFNISVKNVSPDRGKQSHRNHSSGFSTSVKRNVSDAGAQDYKNEFGGFGTSSSVRKEIYDEGSHNSRKDSSQFNISVKKDISDEEPRLHRKDSGGLSMPMNRNITDEEKQSQRTNYGGFKTSGKRETSEEKRQRNEEDNINHPGCRRLSREGAILIDYCESESSVAASGETSDEEKTSHPLLKVPHISQSNASITSGYSHTVRPKRASSAPVRRCKSLQARNSKQILEEDLSSRRIPGSHVAKFVLQLEKGIQRTMENMNPRKNIGLNYSESFSGTPASAPVSKNTSFVSKPLTGENKSLEFSASNLDSNSFLPEGNDYKIVFVSSDSCTNESDVNSSMESETIQYDSEHSLRNNSLSTQSCSSQRTPKQHNLKNAAQSNLVDSAVIIDAKDYSSEEDVKSRSLTPSEKHSSFVKNKEEDKSIQENIRRDSMEQSHWHFPKQSLADLGSTTNQLVPPSLNGLGQNDLELMLQQTEIVQAEAQALQKALMGAFDSNSNPLNAAPSYKNYEPNQNSSPQTMNYMQNSRPTNEPPNFQIKKDVSNYLDSSSTNKGFHSFVPTAKKSSDTTQNEYENVQLSMGKCDNENSYENVNFRSDYFNKPIKVCKSVCIQTDLEPLSGEDEDSYETADYSDVSFDSQTDERSQNFLPSMRVPPIISDAKGAKDSFLSHRSFGMKEQHKSNNSTSNSNNRGKGEESFIPPFSYLPETPPSATLPLPTAVHLRLASDRDSSSVSLSSECEAVRESASGNRVRAGAVLKLPESEKNVINSSQSKVKALTKWSSSVQSVNEYSLPKDPIVTPFEVPKSTSDESNTLPKRSLDLTSGGDNFPHPSPTFNLKGFKAKRNTTLPIPFRMSSQEDSEKSSLVSDTKEGEVEASPQQSNVNASKEAISHQECNDSTPPADANDVVLEENSSGTSECDDTDEETHVSRSYNVSKPSKTDVGSESDECGDFSNQKTSPSISESDTDVENNFSEEYDVTKVSESESENGKEDELIVSGDTKEINHAEKNALIIDSKKQIGATSDIEDTELKSAINNENKVDNSTYVEYKLNENKIDECTENQTMSDDSLENTSANNDNLNSTENCIKKKVSILDSVEKTDLPECDQGLRNEEELVCNNETENTNSVELKEAILTEDLQRNDVEEPCAEKSGVCDSENSGIPVDILDFVVENKNETESNLEIESEIIKPINDLANNIEQRSQFEDLKQINKTEESRQPIESNYNSEGHRDEEEKTCDILTTNITTDSEINTIIASETDRKDLDDKRNALSDKEINETAAKTTASSSDTERNLKHTQRDSHVAVNNDQVAEIDGVEQALHSDKNEVAQKCNAENDINISDNSEISEKNQTVLRKENVKEQKENEDKNVISDISDCNVSSNEEERLKRESIGENPVEFVFKGLEIQVNSEALENIVTEDSSEKKEGPNEPLLLENDDLKNTSESSDRKSNECSELTPAKITGSTEVEQQQSCSQKRETVSHSTLSDPHEKTSVSDENENCDEVKNKTSCVACDIIEEDISESSKRKDFKGDKGKVKEKEICSSGESGRSSGEGSDSETKDSSSNVVKINVVENDDNYSHEANSKGDGSVPLAMGTVEKELKPEEPTLSQGSFQGLISTKFSKSFTPSIPLRKSKQSSSSDGLSSSSDIERSDADASDSADTVIEGNRQQSKSLGYLKQSIISDEVNRDSDRPSSADSVLQGADSESQCSDGSEEGNLISIVAVGEETIPRPSSQGKIYIRSDLTDSDVQIKPTCIVVTGSSGAESEDGECQEQPTKNDLEGNDVTILEVTSDHRRDHVMSVRVTSPESSRSASPARKSNVSELQSMILTTRERQQQFRKSTEMKEPSSLTNYFTVTLGTDSPAAPRRLNKTPEVRRRKVLDRELNESPPSPVSTKTLPSTLTQSPSLTPSPTFTPTSEHTNEDYTSATKELSEKQQTSEKDNVFDNFYNEYDDHYDSFNDLEVVREEGEGAFDSIDDAESVGESNYSETSSEENFEREEELRGYCKRGYDFTLHTIIEESCEESDYDKKIQEEDSLKRDPSELEKYFYFGLGNGPAETKKYANEESEYSDTFSETSSSIYSEGMESLDCEEMDPAELASSRLEKYFSGFAGFERQPSIRSVGEESELLTDESGSVGSDSEGSPSPEQPRKKLFRSRGVRSVSSNRSHGYSSDKGEGVPSDGSHHSGDGDGDEKTLASGEDEGSTESDETAFEKSDGQFDTIKRRKKKKILAELSEKKMETTPESKDEALLTKKAEIGQKSTNDCETTSKKNSEEEINNFKDKSEEAIEGNLAGRRYQSCDSGFIGSSDDLLREKSEDFNQKDGDSREKKTLTGFEETSSNRPREKTEAVDEATSEVKQKECNPDNDSNNNEERSSNEGKVSRSSTGSSADLPPYSQSKGSHNLSRKDSFNNWSSDEETNIMMNKMRIFFKNMFSNVPKEMQKGQRVKSPQLVMFEAKLTNLMRSVPGINDEQVKEIVEYLSSEETWSDSYDSSDYTSSDLEGAYALLDRADPELKSELQEQISASCQQIIKFYPSREPSDTDSAHSLLGGKANSESSEASSKDTAFVYQKLMSSMSHMKPDSDRGSIGSGSQSTSPSLLTKVMPYIRDRLVALMHEVSAGSENGDDADSFNGCGARIPSPRQKLFLPKKHNLLDNISLDSSIDKSSITSTSFESEDSPTDTEQSPESETGTPKIFRCQKLSIISEKSSTEDFTSLESQRTVFSSHGSPRHHFRLETSKMSHLTPSQRSLEERSGALSGIHSGRGKEDERFGSKEHIGFLKSSRKGSHPETRKAKSHLSLEKIHHEEMKATGERSESLGDLLDRVRSSSEFSSSYEQLDSDSTLKASDSLERHIGSSSSNVRLNASSRGSLTTSSRGSLATSSRGSLNASSRGSLQGSSGPDEEEERKTKKLSFFRYARRSSVPDASKDTPSAEVRSTTLPRSTPAHILTTGTLPRSQSSQGPPSRSPSSLLPSHFTYTTTSIDRPSHFHGSGPRSARYHPPGYRPPPAGLPSKRTFPATTFRKDRLWPSSEESASCVEDAVSTASSSGTGGPSSSRAPPPPSSLAKLGSGSPLGSSLGGSFGRTSGNDSVGGSLASFDNSPDEEEAKRRESDGGRSPLVALGPKSRSESLASVYSSVGEGRFGAVLVQGEIRVALQYNYKEGQLECHIIQSRDLAAVDTKRNRTDPYVKAYLLPDKSKSGKRKTKVKRHTLNPFFDEIFKFGTTLNEMESRTLWISVWHSDMFGRNVFLGEVLIPLSDALFEDSSPRWYGLVDRNEPIEDMNYGAVLIVALKFVPPDSLATGGAGGSTRKSKRSRGALQVRVKEASGLTTIKSQNPPDPICKGVLMPEKGKGSKQKTNTIRKTSSPKWNHTMTFDDVTLQELTERSLELSIFNHDRFASSEFLGGCRLNLGRGQHKNRIVEWLDASGLEQKLWEQMLDRPNLWVESSILLRPNIERPIYSSAFTD